MTFANEITISDVTSTVSIILVILGCLFPLNLNLLLYF